MATATIFLTIRNGWVSASGTRDGGGYSQTFYGSGCTPYNGWIFFPTSFLTGPRSRKLGPKLDHDYG